MTCHAADVVAEENVLWAALGLWALKIPRRRRELQHALGSWASGC